MIKLWKFNNVSLLTQVFLNNFNINCKHRFNYGCLTAYPDNGLTPYRDLGTNHTAGRFYVILSH